MRVGDPCSFDGDLRSSPGVREREGREKRGGDGTIGPAELTVFPSRYRGCLVLEGSPKNRGAGFAAVAAGESFRRASQAWETVLLLPVPAL